MADPNAKYSIKLGLTLEKDGEEGLPMMDANVAWNGLTYAMAVMLEKEVVGVLGSTVEWGEQLAEEIGQPLPIPKPRQG